MIRTCYFHPQLSSSHISLSPAASGDLMFQDFTHSGRLTYSVSEVVTIMMLWVFHRQDQLHHNSVWSTVIAARCSCPYVYLFAIDNCPCQAESSQPPRKPQISQEVKTGVWLQDLIGKNRSRASQSRCGRWVPPRLNPWARISSIIANADHA